eukprot:6014579-Amphidinium_carterae.1
MCETTTSLGHVTVVRKKRAICDSIQTIKGFLVENGLQTMILQSDSEPSITSSQQAPHHSHQPQGLQHRLHTAHYSTTWYIMVHHNSWLLNTFPQHEDGKTSYERNWKREYKQPILRFGEKAYVDTIMAENMKLYQRNQEQKQEAVWDRTRLYYETTQ